MPPRGRFGIRFDLPAPASTSSSSEDSASSSDEDDDSPAQPHSTLCPTRMENELVKRVFSRALRLLERSIFDHLLLTAAAELDAERAAQRAAQLLRPQSSCGQGLLHDRLLASRVLSASVRCGPAAVRSSSDDESSTDEAETQRRRTASTLYHNVRRDAGAQDQEMGLRLLSLRVRDGTLCERSPAEATQESLLSKGGVADDGGGGEQDEAAHDEGRVERQRPPRGWPRAFRAGWRKEKAVG